MTAGASTSPVFDFTSLDYESSVADLIRFSQVTFPDDQWTDYNDSNPATGLIQNLGYATDLLAYTANAQNLETIVTTLVREQNFRNIAKSFDYVLKSASPSKGTERVFVDPLGPFPFTISKHLQFSTLTTVIFQPDADLSVGSAPVSGYVDIPITQGEEHFEQVIGTTNGQPNQDFVLGNPFLIDGTLVVQFGLDAYSIVDNFISVGPTTKAVTLSTDEDGNTTVIAGDGINGIIPPKGQTAKATYKTGGGTETNVTHDTITRVSGTSDGSAIPAQILSVTNIASTTSGGPKQSLDNAKQNLPLALKANDRCVTLQDYATLAVALVPGVLKASAVAGTAFGGSRPVLLFVVPNGGGNPSDSLRNTTIVKLKDKRSSGKRIRVLDPVYVSLLIESDSFVQQNSPALDTVNKQRELLKIKYALEAVDFGVTFDLQEVYEDTGPANISGIKRVFYRTFTVKPYYARHVNRPTTGNGTIDWIVTNLDTVRRREWSVQIAPPISPVNCGRFLVKQRRLGTVTSVTDSLVSDEGASYVGNELFTGGWVFHPRPEDSDATFTIFGNTSSTITTAPGLLVETEPDDPYVVEKDEPTYGKVLRTTITSDIVSSPTVTILSSDSWEPGDLVHFSDNELDYYTVTAVGVNTLTLDRPATTASGSFVDYVWQSGDASVKFSVINGTTVFTPGDELYVDTYPRAGDLVLRPENYPILDDSNLFLTAIGGVK